MVSSRLVTQQWVRSIAERVSSLAPTDIGVGCSRSHKGRDATLLSVEKWGLPFPVDTLGGNSHHFCYSQDSRVRTHQLYRYLWLLFLIDGNNNWLILLQFYEIGQSIKHTLWWFSYSGMFSIYHYPQSFPFVKNLSFFKIWSYASRIMYTIVSSLTSPAAKLPLHWTSKELIYILCVVKCVPSWAVLFFKLFSTVFFEKNPVLRAGI